VVVWGDDLGGGALSVPTNLNEVVAIASRGHDNMALKADGSIVSWGNNVFTPTNHPVTAAIAVGSTFFLALVTGQAPGPPPIPPRIVSQPVSQTVGVGAAVTFSVSTVGYGLRYQWFHNETNLIAGATNRSLLLPAVQFSQAGSYRVVVSNSIDTVVSDAALLHVLPALLVRLAPVIHLDGQVGARYRIEYVNAVGDANAWTALTVITLTNSRHLYADLSAIDQPKRFYRATAIP
jgi:hypothetical protein